MVVEQQIANPIETLVNVIVASAHARKARFIAIEEGRLRFWIDDGWAEEEAMPVGVFERVVKRHCVMMGVLAPGVFARKDAAVVVGKLQFASDTRRMYTLVRIDRAERGLRALLELVDEQAFAERAEPRLPSEHPYRG